MMKMIYGKAICTTQYHDGLLVGQAFQGINKGMTVLVLASCSAISSIGIRPQAVRSVESILTPAIIP